jgi:hypothetical protein
MLTKLLWALNPEAWNRSNLTTVELKNIKNVLQQAIEKRGE